MGVCMSKAKSFAETIDKKHIEMSVKARKVSIAERALALAQDYTRRIAAGETVVVKPEEFLPKTELDGIQQSLGEASTMPQRLKTALYVASNQIFRNTIKQEIWVEIKAGLEARKLPAPIVQHSQIGCDQAVEMALTKQVGLMDAAIGEGRPMVSEEETKEVADWKAAKAKEAAAKEAAAKKDGVAPVDSKSAEKGGLVEKEKEYALDGEKGQSGGQYERNTEIAAV
jgi:hypothetical protein